MHKFVTLTNNTESKSSKIQKLENDLKNIQKRINSPKVDLVEVDNFYKIRIELPGVDKESIKIQIKESQIVLLSYTKHLISYTNENVIYREARYNESTRRIKLPSPVKYDQLNIHDLHLDNGVLYLEFQKMNHDADAHMHTHNHNNTHNNHNNIDDWADVV
jgi:HSP20 family protein